MNTVNKPFRKKDAMQLVTGQPVYMDDLVPADCQYGCGEEGAGH